MNDVPLPDSPSPPVKSPTIAPDGKPDSAQPAWRQDFPIDWPQDHYVARRDFTKFLGLTSLAFVVGQFWIGLKSLWESRNVHLEKPIARIDEIPVGGSLVFTYPDDQHHCLLLRPDESTWLAYSQSCTHLACAVVPRIREGVLYCPCHQGFFDLESGRPTAGPPRRPLPRIHVERRGDTIYATGLEVRTT